MQLKELRPVLANQAEVKVTVESGQSSTSSGKMLMFDIDTSLDELTVKQIAAEDSTLLLMLVCTPEEFSDTDWASAFNKDSVISVVSGTDDTMSEPAY